MRVEVVVHDAPPGRGRRGRRWEIRREAGRVRGRPVAVSSRRYCAVFGAPNWAVPGRKAGRANELLELIVGGNADGVEALEVDSPETARPLQHSMSGRRCCRGFAGLAAAPVMVTRDEPVKGRDARRRSAFLRVSWIVSGPPFARRESPPRNIP